MKYRVQLNFTSERGNTTKFVRGSREEIRAEFEYLLAHGAEDIKILSTEEVDCSGAIR